jgi:hypothetical protein
VLTLTPLEASARQTCEPSSTIARSTLDSPHSKGNIDFCSFFSEDERYIVGMNISQVGETAYF